MDGAQPAGNGPLSDAVYLHRLRVMGRCLREVRGTPSERYFEMIMLVIMWEVEHSQGMLRLRPQYLDTEANLDGSVAHDGSRASESAPLPETPSSCETVLPPSSPNTFIGSPTSLPEPRRSEPATTGGSQSSSEPMHTYQQLDMALGSQQGHPRHHDPSQGK